MKRITNKICAVLLSGIFMVMTGVNVNAAEQEYPPAEAVFPEEKVLQIENQIKNTCFLYLILKEVVIYLLVLIFRYVKFAANVMQWF